MALSVDTTIPTFKSYRCTSDDSSQGAVIRVFEQAVAGADREVTLVIQIPPGEWLDKPFGIGFDVGSNGEVVLGLRFDDDYWEHFQLNHGHQLSVGYRESREEPSRWRTAATGRRVIPTDAGKPLWLRWMRGPVGSGPA